MPVTTEEFITRCLSYEPPPERSVITRSGKWHPTGSRRQKARTRGRKRLNRNMAAFVADVWQERQWPWRVQHELNFILNTRMDTWPVGRRDA